MLEQLTNRNVFVKTFDCGVNVKAKDCAGWRPFQHKLQHHCFHIVNEGRLVMKAGELQRPEQKRLLRGRRYQSRDQEEKEKELTSQISCVVYRRFEPSQSSIEEFIKPYLHISISSGSKCFSHV